MGGISAGVRARSTQLDYNIRRTPRVHNMEQFHIPSKYVFDGLANIRSLLNIGLGVMNQYAMSKVGYNDYQSVVDDEDRCNAHSHTLTLVYKGQSLR